MSDILNYICKKLDGVCNCHCSSDCVAMSHNLWIGINSMFPHTEVTTAYFMERV